MDLRGIEIMSLPYPIVSKDLREEDWESIKGCSGTFQVFLKKEIIEEDGKYNHHIFKTLPSAVSPSVFLSLAVRTSQPFAKELIYCARNGECITVMAEVYRFARMMGNRTFVILEAKNLIRRAS